MHLCIISMRFIEKCFQSFSKCEYLARFGKYFKKRKEIQKMKERNKKSTQGITLIALAISRKCVRPN